MSTLVLLAISLLIGSGICKPTNPDYDRYIYVLDNLTSSQEDSIELSSPERDYIIFKRDLIVTKDNSTANLTSKQTFLLTDIISRVEGSLVQTAFDIVSLFKISNQTTTIETKNCCTTESSPLVKKKPEQQQPVIPLFQNISSLEIPASSNSPAHVSIDRVTFYVANSDYFPLIPTFKLMGHKQDDKKDETVVNKTSDEAKNVESTIKQKRSISTTTTSTSTTQTVGPTSPVTEATHESSSLSIATSSSIDLNQKFSTTSSTSSSHLPISPTASHLPISSTTLHLPIPTTPVYHSISSSTHGVSTSTPLSTSAVTPIAKTTTTTSKNPVKELKKTEEDVKEKVAEIQAEPIILSSRV